MKATGKTLAFAVALLVAGGLPRARQAGPPPPRPSADQPGPWNNDILVFHVSRDGGATRLATFGRAGVSTLARLKDGRLIAGYQHFPAGNEAEFDKVAVRFSGDEGKSWTGAEVIRLTGWPDGMRFPFDPTLVPLPDGRVRLYFTSARRFDRDLPAIYSAISGNGLDYVVEPGRRFGIDERPVIDCAVALHDGSFHLYSPDNGTMPQPRPGPPQPEIGMGAPPGAGYHAISHDGLSFERASDVHVDGRRRWLGAAYSDGTTMSFFGTGDPGAGGRRGGLWIGTSADGVAWRVTGGVEVAGADPGVVPARDGGWIVSVTGPPRGGGSFR